MALVIGTKFDHLMTPNVGQFTQNGNVIDRPANKTTNLADILFGGQKVSSAIFVESADQKLKEGADVLAVIKSTDVMIARR